MNDDTWGKLLEPQRVIYQCPAGDRVCSLQNLKTAVEQESVDTVRFHPSADAIRCFEDAVGHSFVLQVECAAEAGQSASDDHYVRSV